MVSHLNNEVIRLTRLSIGSVKLGSLKKRRYRELTKKEIESLVKISSKPILIKLPLTRPLSYVLKIVNTLNDLDILGYTTFNTLPIDEPRISIGKGGLSGLAIHNACKYLCKLIKNMSNKFIVFLGGVLQANQVLELLKLGVNLVGFVTLFALEGPFGILRLNYELSKSLNSSSR